MKRFTFTLMGFLLLLGGVNIQAQTVTTLYLDGGNSIEKSNEVYTDGHVTSATVQFGSPGFNGTYSSGLSGTNWVAEYHEGETHSFTINLNEGAPAGFHFYIAPKYYGNFNDNNAPKYKNETIPAGATSITINLNSTDCPALLEQGDENGNGKGTYKYVWIINTEGSKDATLNIASITRTITTASSVASPTISPASGTYDGDLTVTITKGEGNDKVVYSISGATTGNATDAEFTENSKTLNLTGTGTITVTATGYEGEDVSSEVENTYTYSIPSGQSSTTSGHTFNSWESSNAIVISNSVFSSIETGDYVVLDVANVAQNGTVLGFRDSWSEPPYRECTTTSGGNGAKGTLNIGDTQWWMKVNSDVVNSLKNHEVRMQGGMVPSEPSDISSSVTLNSIKVYKCKELNESSDNSTALSSKINDVVVELTRSFVADTWNTVCLPFVPTSAQADELFGSDYKLAAYTGVSGTTMHFTTITIDEFEAGKPYLVLPKTGCATSTTVLFDVDITAKTPQTVTHEDYSFVGNFTQKTFSSEECNSSLFVATGNELMKPNNNSTLKSLRCYFTVPSGSIATARRFTIDDEEGGTTGINAVHGEGFMVNGYYNLNGQRVAKPTKGLFIVNGKKVVIK